MNLRSSLSRTPPIGISLDRRRLTLAQPGTTGTAARTAALACPHEPWDDHAWATLASDLASLIARRGFAGRDIAIALPAWAQSSLAVQLPPRASGAPLDAIAAGQLAEAVNTQQDEIEAAWWETPAPAHGSRRPAGATGPGPMHAIVSGGRRATFEAIGHACADAGLHACALVPRSWCLAAGAAASGPGPDAVLEAGFHAALLTIFRNGEVLFERSLPEHGLEHVIERLSDKLGIEDDAAALLTTDEHDAAAGPLAAHPATRALLDWAASIIESSTAALADEVAASLDYFGSTVGLSANAVRVIAPGHAVHGALTRHLSRLNCRPVVERMPTSAVALGAALAALGTPQVGRAAA
ncbi:MAG: hypothetical protein ACKVS8_09060 [Phycisphaerales bacterium]